MDCFNNTCLSCDRECEDRFCSPSCKLADDEKGARTSLSQSISSPITPGRSSISSQSPSPHTKQPSSSYFMWNPSMESSQQNHATERSLTPSSSRSSLASTSSASSSSNAISAQDTQQLQDYFSSFEKARAAKRRSSLR